MPEKSLILIPCSGRKQRGGISDLSWDKATSVLNSLPGAYHTSLLDSRRLLARRFNYTSGVDLGSAQISFSPLMPAFMRYDGNLYRRIEKQFWTKLREVAFAEVIIVSALYGFLVPWEPIREYNLTMDTSIAHRFKLSRWWVNRGLDSMLRAYVVENTFTEVYCFLSGSYANIGASLASRKSDIKIHYKKYPGLGSGSDYYRGKDVNNLLKRLLS